MQPLVSICIPAFNSGATILATLESISSQTWKNIEVIVGDNASTDNTEEIVRKYSDSVDQRVRVFKNESNLGYSGNCNKLISEAKGECICIYHADDIYNFQIVEKQVGALLAYPGSAGVFCFKKMFTECPEVSNGGSYSIELSEQNFIEVDLRLYLDNLIGRNENILVCPTSMVRAEVYSKLGGYDTSISYVEDVNMWIRILTIAKLIIVNEKLLNYRVSSGQGSSYYISTTRKEVLPLVGFLKGYLKGTPQMLERYDLGLKKIESCDLIFLAKNAALRGEFSFYKKLILMSRAMYSVGFDRIKFSVLQKSPILMSYFLVRNVAFRNQRVS